MRNMRKLKITKFLSWYYIFAFLVVVGLGIYLYRGFRFVEGAATQSATPAATPACPVGRVYSHALRGCIIQGEPEQSNCDRNSDGDIICPGSN
jgi:hypothetical protein